MTTSPKELIARRVAKEVRAGSLVNLGIGLPTSVVAYLPPEVNAFFLAEDGLIGVGPPPPPGMENPALVDAGGGFVSALPGAASLHSTMVFGLIRGGHLDLTVLGGLQVDARGAPGQLDDPGKARAGDGRGDGSRDRRPARHRRDDPYRQGGGEGRRGVHDPADLAPACQLGRHRDGGDRADPGGSGASRAPASRSQCRGATAAKLIIPATVPEYVLS